MRLLTANALRYERMRARLGFTELEIVAEPIVTLQRSGGKRYLSKGPHNDSVLSKEDNYVISKEPKSLRDNITSVVERSASSRKVCQRAVESAMDKDEASLAGKEKLNV